jgi:hypothetical protein
MRKFVNNLPGSEEKEREAWMPGGGDTHKPQLSGQEPILGVLT